MKNEDKLILKPLYYNEKNKNFIENTYDLHLISKEHKIQLDKIHNETIDIADTLDSEIL